jgi:hypothetical protein
MGRRSSYGLDFGLIALLYAYVHLIVGSTSSEPPYRRSCWPCLLARRFVGIPWSSLVAVLQGLGSGLYWMNFSSSLLEALIGGVCLASFFPPLMRKGMAAVTPSVAIESCRFVNHVALADDL